MTSHCNPQPAAIFDPEALLCLEAVPGVPMPSSLACLPAHEIAAKLLDMRLAYQYQDRSDKEVSEDSELTFEYCGMPILSQAQSVALFGVKGRLVIGESRYGGGVFAMFAFSNDDIFALDSLTGNDWRDEDGLKEGLHSDTLAPIAISYKEKPCEAICKLVAKFKAIPKGCHATFSDVASAMAELGPEPEGMGLWPQAIAKKMAPLLERAELAATTPAPTAARRTCSPSL